ncbi:hypothetical protein M3212_09555 [Alkalihalobacillus oceani]|nr:CD1375 family protein [Halalkalibacter oceani]MCM3761029.1 hypothetical protein [Halalkalibacter oceani]
MMFHYMIPVYAFLIKTERRTIHRLPETYQIPVAEYLAEEIEADNREAG